MTQYTKAMVKAWLEAALVRAIKTAAQTAVAMIPVGVTVQDVGWTAVASTSSLAAVLSLLTSVAGLPEVDEGADLPTIMSTRPKHAAQRTFSRELQEDEDA